jgi:hypothetical protein
VFKLVSFRRKNDGRKTFSLKNAVGSFRNNHHKITAPGAQAFISPLKSENSVSLTVVVSKIMLIIASCFSIACEKSEGLWRAKFQELFC